MKILLVDDESKKLSKLCKLLNEIDGISPDNIITELDLNGAKLKLQKELYDFLILDLNMPEVLGEAPCGSAGKDFIDEIIGVDSYIKPKEIIILTEYEKLKIDFNKDNDTYHFSVFHYDAASVEWANSIKGKIRYSLMREQKQLSKAIDVAIITAVNVETNAVKKLSQTWKKLTIPNDPTIYYKTYFGSNNEISVIHAQQSEMGMSAASNLATKMILSFTPKYIIMVGIAAGLKKNNQFGDILIPTEIWNYSSGKYIVSKEEAGEGNYLYEPDPKNISLKPDINEKLNQNFDDLLYNIRKGFSSKVVNDLKIVRGPMACGSAVMANSKLVDDLVKKHSRKTIGLDMESYGMFYATSYTNNNLCIPICIKSICDFADNNKDDNFQEYAAYTSAMFMKCFVENELF